MDRNNPLKFTQSRKLGCQWVTIILFSTLLVMSGSACGTNGVSSEPINQVSESDLIGVWESHYSRYSGVEFLVIKEDGTYEQIFNDVTGYLYVSEINRWHSEISTSGRLFVRFERGRYFPEGPSFANLLGVDPLDHSRLYPFYDPEEEASVYMDNELILEVIPSKSTKGIVLGHFLSDINARREYFTPAVP